MTTLCPNCSKPARKDAVFCGYCGTNLSTTGIIQPAVAMPPVAETTNTKKQGKKKDRGRTAAIIAIILLILIIAGAYLAQNWVDVLTFLFTSIYRMFV